MIFRRLLLVALFNVLLSTGLSAQNLFPEKIDLCLNEQFCMDCGTPKATCDSFTLAVISAKINYRYNLKNGFGTLAFQVLVNGEGNSCVLSHTDGSHSQLTTDLIIALNTCIWKPAIVDGKGVSSSVNVIFKIADGKISGQMQRLDLSEMKPADSAIVYNKQYQYRNPLIVNYSFTSFNRYNSPLPDNIGQTSLVDNADILWYATAHGLTRYDGKNFAAINEANSPLPATTAIHAMAVDKENNKWMYSNKDIYMLNDKTGWQNF
jgi:ligand-binding sensor domain-containing protein